MIDHCGASHGDAYGGEWRLPCDTVDRIGFNQKLIQGDAASMKPHAMGDLARILTTEPRLRFTLAFLIPQRTAPEPLMFSLRSANALYFFLRLSQTWGPTPKTAPLLNGQHGKEPNEISAGSIN
jgi:hypothetical protein